MHTHKSVAMELADVLPSSVYIYRVEMVEAAGDGCVARASVVRARVGATRGNVREVAGLGADMDEAVADLVERARLEFGEREPVAQVLTIGGRDLGVLHCTATSAIVAVAAFGAVTRESMRGDEIAGMPLGEVRELPGGVRIRRTAEAWELWRDREIRE